MNSISFSSDSSEHLVDLYDLMNKLNKLIKESGIVHMISLSSDGINITTNYSKDNDYLILFMISFYTGETKSYRIFRNSKKLFDIDDIEHNLSSDSVLEYFTKILISML